MAEVSTASTVVATALTGVLSSVGESSLTRVVAGADAAAHNLIDGVVSPTTRNIAKSRGYKYRNNGTPGPAPALTSQQLQVTKTSMDPRIMRIQRDAVNLLTRASQTSDAIGRQHPTFQEIGAVHLRLTLPVPTTTKLRGYKRKKLSGDLSPESTDNESESKPPDKAPLHRTDTHFVLPSPEEERRVDPFLLGSERADVDRDCEAILAQGATSTSLEVQGSDTRSSNTSDHSDDESEIPTPDDVALRHVRPLGAFGNALKARSTIDRLRGVEKSESVNIECSLCGWLSVGKAKGFLSKVLNMANPTGARNLYVLDVILPTEVLTACMETADSLIGEDKPAKNLHLQKARRKLKRLLAREGMTEHPAFNYLATVTNLVVMALLLDSGDTGKNHCDIFAYSGAQPLFKDFFATQHLEEAIEDLDSAKKEAGHPTERVVWSVPAPEVKGTLSEKLVMYETAAFGEYELTEKKPVIGAVQVGVDLMGKPSPNDHKNPLSFISAVYRHLGDSDTTVAEGTPHEYVVHLDRSEKSKLSAEHDRVWDDMIEDHCSDFVKMLNSSEQRFDYDFLDDGKPNSYCTATYEKWLEEQLADESFFAADNAMHELLSHTKATADHLQELKASARSKAPVGHMQELKASAQCKKGEDSSRARAVISPGIAGTEGLHQARTSPMVKALEALHAILYNHTNLKGLTEETKRIRFAEFLRAVPKGAVVFGTDKSKNDACFREAVWKKCVKYLAKMNDIFEEQVVTKAYVFSPNEDSTRQSFPNGTLDMKYWVIKLTPLLAFLLSGIGPTSFFNRLESTVENGTAVLEVFGEAAYQKWRIAERRATVSEHPAWSLHALPHVAQFVEWEPLAPHMVTDTSIKCDKLEDKQIESNHMGIYEGDDQSHALIPPKTDEWKDLGPKDVVMKYSSAMSRATGFIFEAALVADDMDMVGRNSVFEMLSAWIALPNGRADAYEVAVIVPKILKAIRKLPHCTISSQHTIIRDDDNVPVDVAHDEKFWSLALTKYYALAIINQESLGVRGLFLAHGDYCYQQLERQLGKQRTYAYGTIYGDRDPERRQIEEAASTTFGQCGDMRDRAHEVLASVKKERVVRTCCAAWRSELPELVAEPKEKVVAALLAFDSISMMLEITDQHVRDPMLLWEELDIGCLLEPLVMHATTNHRKVAAMFRSSKLLADSEETVILARKYAGMKPDGSANKDGRPDTAADPKKSGKGKGKGKGKDTPGKGKGKGSADAKGKEGKGKNADAHGKGKNPKPSSKPGAAGDSWWRTSGR